MWEPAISADRFIRCASEVERMARLRANTTTLLRLLPVFPSPALDDDDRLALVALGGNIMLH